MTQRPRVAAAPARRNGRLKPPEIAGADVLLEELFRRSGMDVAAYRSTALHRRVPACLRFLRVPDVESARRKLADQPHLQAGALGTVLLGVTDFCRDPVVFERMRTLILPGWRRWDRGVRVWSAACSDGRELYSVAILLQNEGLLRRAELLGTDCREDAIDRAREGEFSSEALSRLAPDWRVHFSCGRTGARVGPQLRHQIRWSREDLFAHTAPGPWDLILWRNMAIYLEPPAAELIWRRLVAELAPGGYLVCGKADQAPVNLDLDKIAPCIFRKRFCNP